MVRYVFNGMLMITWTMVPTAYITALRTGDTSLVMWGLAAWLTTGMIAVAAQKFNHNNKRKKQIKQQA